MRFISGVKAVASDTVITLYSNQLTRFESPVFKLLLAKLQPFGGQPFANIQINLSKCKIVILIFSNLN